MPELELERKALSLELKADGAEGSFRATFATFNVVDHDGDVTKPKAFESQEVKIAQWGHNWGGLPVGKGTIGFDDTKAWVDGQFFMETQHGADTYRTVKALGALQQWSYGFAVTKASYGTHEGKDVRFLEGLDVFEVSPVMLGAGIGTVTESIKSGLTFADEFESVLAIDRAFVDRMKALAAVRGNEGRTLSAVNWERTSRYAEVHAEMQAELQALLVANAPKSAVNPLSEFARFQAMRARLLGVA